MKDEAATAGKAIHQCQTFTIGELAEMRGLTVRNLRAYLQLGVLHPGCKEGRETRYDASHVNRLSDVASYRARGYSLVSIAELLGTSHKTRINTDLGLARELVESWFSPSASYDAVTDLEESFPSLTSHPEVVTTAVKLGIASLDGRELTVHDPEMLRIGVELVDRGMTLDEVLAELDVITESLTPLVEQVLRLRRRLHLDEAEPDDLPTNTIMPALILTVGSSLTRRIFQAAVDEENSKLAGD